MTNEMTNTNKTMNETKETEMTNEMTNMNETKENEMTNTTETAAEISASAKKVASALKDLTFSIDPNNYGFKLATEQGEYGANFHMDDDNNWGINFTSPNDADAKLDFTDGEGTVSYSDAEGDQKVDGFNFTSPRMWLERFGIMSTTTAEETEELAAEEAAETVA